MFRKRRPLVAGALTLFVSGLFIRAISTVYRIALVRIAGEDVLGLFQLSLPVYRLGWTLATAGMDVAINQLTADADGRGDQERARRFRVVGVRLTVMIAFVVSLTLWLSRHYIAEVVLTDSRTVISLSLMGALLFPAALSAAYRGVLQGQQRMGPIAASTALEVALRSPIVLYLVAIAVPLGVDWGSGAIILGLTAGEIASILLLVWAARTSMRAEPSASKPKQRFFSRRHSGFHASDFIPFSKALLRLGLPVTASGILNNILSIASVAVIPRRLALTGMAMDEAIRAFGRVSGMALPILHMPMVLISPILHVLEPSVANRHARRGSKAIRPIVKKTYYVAGMLGLATAAILYTVPEWLGTTLYSVTGLGSLVRPLAVAAPFAYIGYVSTSTLYGLGKTGVTMVNSAVGNLVRLVLIWKLAARPEWAIHGVVWSIVADFAVTGLLNTVSLPFVIRRSAR